MSRRRSTTAKLIFSIFVLLSLYISVLISVRNYSTIFIALLTLAWHILANIYCAWISSYRFKNPAAKYVEIKNKFIKKLFLRPLYIGERYTICKHDNRTNIIGLVLNIINIVLFISFEVLLFLPKILSDPYVFTFVIGTRPRYYTHLSIELHSYNEIIPAEVSRLFAFVVSLVLLVFVGLFEHQLKEHRRKIEKNTSKTPPSKAFKEIEWYSPLYMSLVDISVRQNNKKLKFWYDKDQLEHIEGLVRSASKNAELKLEMKGNKTVSFMVVDKTNNSVIFKGLFR